MKKQNENGELDELDIKMLNLATKTSDMLAKMQNIKDIAEELIEETKEWNGGAELLTKEVDRVVRNLNSRIVIWEDQEKLSIDMDREIQKHNEVKH